MGLSTCLLSQSHKLAVIIVDQVFFLEITFHTICFGFFLRPWSIGDNAFGKKLVRNRQMWLWYHYSRICKTTYLFSLSLIKQKRIMHTKRVLSLCQMAQINCTIKLANRIFYISKCIHSYTILILSAWYLHMAAFDFGLNKLTNFSTTKHRTSQGKKTSHKVQHWKKCSMRLHRALFTHFFDFSFMEKLYILWEFDIIRVWCIVPGFKCETRLLESASYARLTFKRSPGDQILCGSRSCVLSRRTQGYSTVCADVYFGFLILFCGSVDMSWWSGTVLWEYQLLLNINRKMILSCWFKN